MAPHRENRGPTLNFVTQTAIPGIKFERETDDGQGVEAVSSVRGASKPVPIAGASAVAAPNEFFAILRCYLPETSACVKLNLALRSTSPYVDDTGARSWWAI